MTTKVICMTMLSFRVDDDVARRVGEVAERLGVDRSRLLRDALRQHLNRLDSEEDVGRWLSIPLDDGERLLEEIADWGPAEEWADWADSPDAAAEDRTGHGAG